MKFKNIIGIVLLFLVMPIILSSVNASSESFEVWTSDISMCKCSIATQKVSVLNLGMSSLFTVSLEGSGSEWADVSEDSFFLNTGETKEFSINYNVPCDASSRDIIIKVKSLKEEEVIIESKLSVGKCKNVLLIPTKTYAKACPCEDLVYSFKVSNSGNFRETYRFEATKFKDDFIFNPSQVTLNPFEQVTVYATLNRNCGEYGVEDFEIKANAIGNKQSSSFQARAVIDACYNNSLTVGKIQETFIAQDSIYELCVDQSYRIPVKVENNANLNNKFILSLEGDKNAELSEDEFILEKGSKATVYINYKPSEEGSKYLYLTSNGVLGDTENKVRIPVKIDNCYDLNIVSPKEIKVESSTIPIYLESVGTKPVNAYVAISSNDNFLLNDKQITVSNKSTLNIKVNQKIWNEVEDLEVYFKIDNGNVVSKKFNVVWGTPFFYTYKWYILLGIIVIVALVALIIYLIDKRRKNFGRRSKKTDKVINNVELSVDDKALDPVEVKKAKKVETKKKVKKTDKIDDSEKLGLRQWIFIIMGLLIIISFIVLIIIYKSEISGFVKDYLTVGFSNLTGNISNILNGSNVSNTSA